MNRFDNEYASMLQGLSEATTATSTSTSTSTTTNYDPSWLRDTFVKVNYVKYNKPKPTPLAISKVIFNDPATIVFWSDKSKTVVKAERDKFDPEKGLAMAISKKFLGNQGNYYNTFKKWLPKEDTKDELSCANCKYRYKPLLDRPCFSCSVLLTKEGK